MLPEHPWLAKGPVCGELFWVHEAKEVGIGFDAAEGKPKVLTPSETELLGFLASHDLPKNKEIYLRMRAWWAANDVWRWLPNSKPCDAGGRCQLIRLLDEIRPRSSGRGQRSHLLRESISPAFGKAKTSAPPAPPPPSSRAGFAPLQYADTCLRPTPPAASPPAGPRLDMQ